MTNTALLRQRIKDSGLKLQYIADYVGISRVSLTMKIENVSEFRQTEIKKLCEIRAECEASPRWSGRQ